MSAYHEVLVITDDGVHVVHEKIASNQDPPVKSESSVNQPEKDEESSGESRLVSGLSKETYLIRKKEFGNKVRNSMKRSLCQKHYDEFYMLHEKLNLFSSRMAKANCRMRQQIYDLFPKTPLLEEDWDRLNQWRKTVPKKYGSICKTWLSYVGKRQSECDVRSGIAKGKANTSRPSCDKASAGDDPAKQVFDLRGWGPAKVDFAFGDQLMDEVFEVAKSAGEDEDAEEDEEKAEDANEDERRQTDAMETSSSSDQEPYRPEYDEDGFSLPS